MKRVFLIVLDSFGIGEAPDAKDFGDEGSNTLLAVSKVCILTCRIWRNWAYLLSTAQRSTVTGRALCRLAPMDE